MQPGNPDEFGVIDAGDIEREQHVETITEADRAEYEADVDHIMQNDLDGDGDVDLKDAALKALSRVDEALQRAAADGGISGAVAKKVSDVIDRIDGEETDHTDGN